jgi:cell division protein FtsB
MTQEAPTTITPAQLTQAQQVATAWATTAQETTAAQAKQIATLSTEVRFLQAQNADLAQRLAVFEAAAQTKQARREAKYAKKTDTAAQRTE